MDHFPLKALSITVLVALGIAALPLTGCDDATEGPEDVATAFLNDLRRGERVAAMDAIWPPTRHEIEAAYDDLEGYLDGDPPVERSRLLVVTRLESPMLISRITSEESAPEEPTDADELTLIIEFRDERSAELPMRWGADESRWYVDLPVDQRRALTVEHAAGDDTDGVVNSERDPQPVPDETDKDE